MAESKPKATIKTMTNAFTPLTIPLRIFPSIISVNELIRGTPGIKKSTDDANECSIVSLKPNLNPSPEISDAPVDANKTHKYVLKFSLCVSCLMNNPINVATNVVAISIASPPNSLQNDAPANATSESMIIRG